MIQVCNKIIEYSFYLLFTLVPLILTPFNWELFEFNKIILTYFLTVIIVSTWLMKMVATGKIIFQRTPLDLPLGLFLLFQVLSTIFSIDRHTSLFGYYSRFNGGLLSIISYILLYYTFVSNMNIKNTLYALRFTLYAATLVAFYGILEHFGIDAKYWVQDVKNRVFSTLGQPNWLAAYIVGLTPLTWGFALLNEKLKAQNAKLKTYLLYALHFTLYTCLLFTKSRSGLMGFGVSYSVFWGLAFLKEKSKILKTFSLFTFFILLLSFLIGTPWTPSIKNFQFSIFNFQTNQQSTINNQQSTISEGGTESGEIRKIVWRGAWRVFKSNPVLGTGPETFAYSYYWYRPREHNDTSEWDFLYNKAHNEYLNYLACTGILGLGSYLLLIGWFIIWNFKKLKTQNAKRKTTTKSAKLLTLNCNFAFSTLRFALLAGFAGLLVSQLFGFSVVITNLFFFLFPAMSFVLVDKTVLEEKFVKRIKLSTISYPLLATILFSILYSLFSVLCLWYSDFLFAQGKKYLEEEASGQAFNYLQKATNLNQFEPLYKNELAEATSLLALNFYSESQATAAAQLSDFAIEQSDQSLKTSPYHLNYLKTRIKIFYNLAQINPDFYQDALKTLIHASEMAPTDAKIFYNLGLLYHYLGQKDEAIKTMEKTVKLKPNYEEAKQKLEEWYNE